MKLSVIVPTCNRPDELALCLRRLDPAAQSMAADQFEVIVTDDSPNQTTEHRVKAQFPWVRWVQGPRRGPAANRNNGARAAAHGLVVFCDDDCLPERGLLKAYADAFAANPTPSVLEGRTSAYGTKPNMFAECPSNENGGHLWSCNFAIQKNVFSGLGGFDERFPYAAMEDMEFALRLRLKGIVPVFVPDARILHPWKIGTDLARRRHLASMIIFRKIHPEHSDGMTAGAYVHAASRHIVKNLSKEYLRQPLFMLKATPSIIQDFVRSTWVLYRGKIDV